MSAPTLLHTPAEMRQWRDKVPAGSRVGFVPTMGALHAGHAELIRRMRGSCDLLVLSIFVNPTQFGPSEDLAKYPRTLEADLEIARSEGVDAVFFPTPERMYPPGYSTFVEESSLTGPLCGAFRPGHFRGVTTVVLKLFNLIEPHVAYFGLKDAQQFFVLHKMARDLDLRVSVEGVATVREADGLALSSRNRYLSKAERETASALYQELQKLAAAADPSRLLEASRARLTGLGFRVQYLEQLSLPGFGATAASTGPSLIAAAAYLGTTRLIDNVILHPQHLGPLGIKIH
jgi:pantoate--beta-alanine ligase